jgi:hypothetical protein
MDDSPVMLSAAKGVTVEVPISSSVLFFESPFSAPGAFPDIQMNQLIRPPVGADLSCTPPMYRPPGAFPDIQTIL